MVFGPAYKGIALAAATAIALSRRGRDVPYAFNRKEAKDHGEGGAVVGAPLAGRVLIVDDVMTAGTAVRESVDVIRAAGATPGGGRDRASTAWNAARARSPPSRKSREHYGIPVIAIATLDDLLGYLEGAPQHEEALRAIAAYRRQYGVSHHA